MRRLPRQGNTRTPWENSVDGAGELLAGTLSGLVRVGAGLAKRALQSLETIAHHTGLRSEMLGGSGDEPCQRGDELACLIEVRCELAWAVVGETELLGGGVSTTIDRKMTSCRHIGQIDDLDLTNSICSSRGSGNLVGRGWLVVVVIHCPRTA